MKKMVCVLTLSLVIAVSAFAQAPLGYHGREYDEQDGYAIVDGVNYHYWLYNIWYYLDNSSKGKKVKYDECLHDIISGLQRWAERQGWTIDYENAVSGQNDNLSLSVKRLMQSRSRLTGHFGQACEVAATIAIEDERHANLVINRWNSMKESQYYIWVYPLIKFR